MLALKTQLFRAGLSALWYSGAARACERWTAGKGAILMLHRVQPGPVPAFAPNARLCISPEYLRALLAGFRAADVDVISLDDALARVQSRKQTRRFVCFTFDDGYRDNLEHALPLFRRFRAPFTVYATTRFADRTLAPWWIALEQVIASQPEVWWNPTRAAAAPESGAAGAGACPAQQTARFATRSVAAKRRVFAELSGQLMQLPAAALSLQLERFLTDHGFSMRELAARDMCSWSELRDLQEAGVEIGCHGASHARLSAETPETIRDELSCSRRLLEARLGQPVRHLAYPYGKPEHVGPNALALASELGFASAVGTHAGCLFEAHAGHRHCLPRVEVTPSFAPSPRYLQTILTGLPLLARHRARVA